METLGETYSRPGVGHQIEIDRNVAIARAQLDAATFAAAWAAGRAMPLEQAIAEALDESAESMS